MLQAVTSGSPKTYPLLDQIALSNGRHVVVIDYDDLTFGQHPTLEKVYKAVSLVLLESIIGSLDSTDFLKGEHKIGFCIVAGRQLKALYLHLSVPEVLTEKDVEGFLLKYDTKVLGLIHHEFDINVLTDGDYKGLTEGIETLKPIASLPYISTFYLEDNPVTGTLGFCIEGAKATTTGRLSQLNMALNFHFLGDLDSKFLRPLAYDYKIAFLTFEEGACTLIETSVTFHAIVKSYEQLSLEMKGQAGLLDKIPAIEGIKDKEYKKMVRPLTHPKDQKQNCVLS